MLDFKSMTLSCTKIQMAWKETIKILKVFNYCHYGNYNMSNAKYHHSKLEDIAYKKFIHR